MLRLFSIIAIILLPFVTEAQQLAFPGAVGFGRFATGGRGGTVVHVTNLNDSGAGSFREAISQPNRVVVFDVAGIIRIGSRLVFSKNLTIAGQTAPGEGVVIYGDGVSFSGADEMICRYMRFRMGIHGTDGKDAAGIANGKNMIFDHVSVSWGRDETFSISWDSKGTEPTNITIQNSIIAQGLQTHSAGGLVQTSGGVTLYRNLYIDNHTRNPKVKGLNQFVNNVVYNWGGGGCYILGDSEGTSWATIVNNYFIKGPNSSASAYSRANENFQLFAAGNLVDADRDGILNGIASLESDYGPVFWVASPRYWNEVPLSDPDRIPQIHPEIPGLPGAAESYEWIVKNAGCILPVRDQVDQFLVEELTSLGKTGRIISSEMELPTAGPGMIFRGNKSLDSDNDGMPDGWEDQNGTDKKVNDAGITGNDGYSNIERYINSIGQPSAYLKYPVNVGAISVTTGSVTLKWTNPEKKATGIVIRYGKNGEFRDSLYVVATHDTARITGLESNTVYSFKMKAVNDSVQSFWSDVYSVNTNAEIIPPLPCENPSPVDKAVLQSNRDIVLSWENKTGIMAGTLYYELFLGKKPDNMTPVASQTSVPNRYFEELEENTTYYWRVRTTNLLGTQEGIIWSFTTGKKTTREMILYLPFDETSGLTASDITRDISATARNFTPFWTTGMKGNCLYTSGNPDNSHLKIAHYPDLYSDKESFTISLWFKSPGGNPDSYLFHKGMHDTTNGGLGKWIGIQYKGTTLTFAIDDNVVKTALNISGAGKWFDNQWHHIACVRDIENDRLLVYIDGVKQGEITDNTGGIGESGDLILGNRNGYFDNPYPGSLDELIIYHAALTASEIAAIHSGLNTQTESTRERESAFSVWPNPCRDKLTIENHFPDVRSVTFQLYNITGSLLFSCAPFPLNGRREISGLGFLPPGVYCCTIRSGSHSFVQKVVKIP